MERSCNIHIFMANNEFTCSVNCFAVIQNDCPSSCKGKSCAGTLVANFVWPIWMCTPLRREDKWEWSGLYSKARDSTVF